jgi:hypothetical protein
MLIGARGDLRGEDTEEDIINATEQRIKLLYGESQHPDDIARKRTSRMRQESQIAQLRASEARVKALQDAAGYTPLAEKTDHLDKRRDDAERQFFSTVAQSIDGVLLQLKELRRHQDDDQDPNEDLFSTIEAGLEKLRSKSLSPHAQACRQSRSSISR